MCQGGRLVADFQAGTEERPDVPDVVGEAFTISADGRWLVWARKVARRSGDLYQPLTGGLPYPSEAVASCRAAVFQASHGAPDPDCTCGFHALSAAAPPMGMPGLVSLDVALSGRILAFEWPLGGLLFRAQRQTVVRVRAAETAAVPATRERPGFGPDDPDGRVATLADTEPRSSGPMHRRLPVPRADEVAVSEHGFYCPRIAERYLPVSLPV